jgi:catechol 2,3-dioxygenase-like lactoylglutathione lyase family enzyme
MITDRNARSVWVEYVFDQTGKKTALVVEADLQLDPAEADFEPERVEALCKDLEQHRRSIAYVDAVRLVRRSDASPREPVEATGTCGAATVNSPLKRPGGRDNGAPGVRPHYHRDYYGAFILDPDGNNIEAVCHDPA